MKLLFQALAKNASSLYACVNVAAVHPPPPSVLHRRLQWKNFEVRVLTERKSITIVVKGALDEARKHLDLVSTPVR